jgi:hypothetical protein
LIHVAAPRGPAKSTGVRYPDCSLCGWRKIATFEEKPLAEISAKECPVLNRSKIAATRDAATTHKQFENFLHQFDKLIDRIKRRPPRKPRKMRWA